MPSGAWIWDLSFTQSTIACAGGIQIQPDHLADSRRKLGSVENLNVSVCQGLTSCSAQTLATVLWLMPSSPASSREDQCVTPSTSGGGVSVASRISARRSRARLGAATAFLLLAMLV